MSPFPFAWAADAPWALALPWFPHRQYTSCYFPQEGCCRTAYGAFCSSITLVTGGFEMPLQKKHLWSADFFSFMCCMSNHPSPLLPSRTSLLWGTSHAGNQRNPSGKLVTARFPSRRAFWMRTASNHTSTFQTSPAGTLDLIVFYMNNPFQ